MRSAERCLLVQISPTASTPVVASPVLGAATTPVSFTLNTTLDVVANPGATPCAQATPGQCSLRQAIVEMDGIIGRPTGTATAGIINMPAGTYVQSLQFETAINGSRRAFSLTFQGVGAGSTIVDGPVVSELVGQR